MPSPVVKGSNVKLQWEILKIGTSSTDQATNQKTTKVLSISFKPTVTQTRNPLLLLNTNFITMFTKTSSEPNPEVQSVHTLIPPLSKIHSNTIFTSIPWSIKQSLPEWFSNYLTCQKNSETFTVVNKKLLLASQGLCYKETVTWEG
jgi:hypothetical protein